MLRLDMVKPSQVTVTKHLPPVDYEQIFLVEDRTSPYYSSSFLKTSDTQNREQKTSDAQKRWGFSLFNHLAKIRLRFTLELRRCRKMFALK